MARWEVRSEVALGSGGTRVRIPIRPDVIASPASAASRFVFAAFLVAGASAMAAGCGSDDPDDPPEAVATDAVLTALVDWAVESDAAPTTTDDETLVVYIAASNGDTIDAAVQASVVAATTDEATVRFADDRSEAIDDQTDDQRCPRRRRPARGRRTPG